MSLRASANIIRSHVPQKAQTNVQRRVPLFLHQRRCFLWLELDAKTDLAVEITLKAAFSANRHFFKNDKFKTERHDKGA